MFIAGILEVIACIALIFAPNIHLLVYLFSIAYGLNIYSYMTGPGFTTQDLFGRKESSEILGIVSLLFAVNEINKKNKKIISKDNKDINKKL